MNSILLVPLQGHTHTHSTNAFAGVGGVVLREEEVTNIKLKSALSFRIPCTGRGSQV